MKHAERFVELQAVLGEFEAFWRPSPFHDERPAWCERLPALAEAVQRLAPGELEAMGDDPDAALGWLAPRLRGLAELAALAALPPLRPRPLPPCGRHFDWSIPGRKRAQIEAFAAHLPASPAPLLEWCAGKGHLGRRLAAADRVAVTSLEIDAVLCEALAALAERAGVAQTALCADALGELAANSVRGRRVVALHACGELHRVLARRAAQGGAHSYHLAPCCYHLGAGAGYRPLSPAARLTLDAGALRLAVTETVTAARAQRTRLARDQAWKLGFIALRREIEGTRGQAFRPVPARWLEAGFAHFCAALAGREGVRLPARVDWAHWLAEGERRRAEVRRFELVRHAFRRPLELWLVLDLALAFEQAGFTVELGSFCARALTPRNLLLHARRA